MRHKVLIPFGNTKVFTGRTRGKDRFQSEFVSWLTATFGSVKGGMWGTEPAPNGLCFKFKEPSHAMVFKLMWGGS